jgi:hypothetical protein
MAFPEKWLSEKAESDPYAEQNGNMENKMGKTNYEVEKEVSWRIHILFFFFVPYRRFNPRFCSVGLQ